MLRMSTDARKHFLLCAVTLCVFYFAVPNQAHSAATLTIAEQEQILWKAIAQVLAKNPAEIDRVRFLGVGSWMSGAATEASDIDITLGHKDPAKERKLARQIQNQVNKLAKGRKHEVMVTYRRHHLFKDRFRGEVGQTFFNDYADASGRGKACFKYKTGENGRLLKSQVDTDRFWLDQKLKVPRQVDGAYRFVEDSYLFLDDVIKQGKTVETQAQKAAKYLNNYETFLRKNLRLQMGDVSSLSRMSPDMQSWTRGMLAYKRDLANKLPEAKARQRLMKFLKINDPVLLERKMGEFVQNSQKYLQIAAEEVQLLEKAKRFGVLKKATNAQAIMRLRQSILRIVGRSVLHGAEMFFIIQTYYDQGPLAAANTAAVILAMHTPGPIGATVMAGEILKHLVGAGVDWAGREYVFDPINSAALRNHIYKPGTPVYIFGRDLMTHEDNPFRGLSRETLICHFNSEEQIRSAVHRYINRVKDLGGGGGFFDTEGSGDITPALMGQMLADYNRSEHFMLRIEDLGEIYRRGLYPAVQQPLRLLVDERQGEDFTKAARAEGDVSFALRIDTQYSEGPILPLSAGWYRQKVCELGLEKAQKWLQKNLVTGFRESYTMEWKINVESPGWRFTGNMPENILESNNQSHARYDYKLTFAPTTSDAGDLRAVLIAKLSYLENNQVRKIVRRIRLQATPGESSARITVRDSETGKLLDGVRVAFSGPRDTAASTVDGVAALDGLPAGKYRISASHPNYQTVSTGGRIKAGKTAKGTLKLKPKANAGLEVKVLDSRDRHAISGAVVKIDGESARSVITADGWARFANLAAGSYQLAINADGYHPLTGQRTIAAGDIVRGKVLLQPIAEPRTKQPKAEAKKEPDQKLQRDPNACYAPIAKRIAELRASNQAQNPQSGGVYVRTLDRDSQCMAEWNRCRKAAKKTYDACPPDAQGTYAHCQQAHAKSWIDCANQELDCEEKKARQECGM